MSKRGSLGAATRLAVALGLLGLLGPRRAWAGNQEAVFLSNQAALSGGAVVAWVDDGGAAWYNPAGLAEIEGTSVDLSASAFVLRYYHLPDAARTRLGGQTHDEDASFTEVVSVPSALTVVRKLSDDVAGALAVFVPHQEDLLVKGGFSQRADPGYQWSFAASRRVARYYAGPALGVRLAPSMRLGLSLFGTYESRVTSRAFGSSLDEPSSPQVTKAIVTLDQRLESKLFGTSWVLGWRWDPHVDWSLGVALRGPLLHATGWSELAIEDSFSRLHASEPAQVGAHFLHLDTEPDAFDVMEPGRIVVGVARRVGPGRVELEGEWQSAASGGGRLRDATWNMRLGGSFVASERFTLGGGLFTDRSPEPEPTDLGETRIDFYGSSFGVQYRTPHEVSGEDGEPAGLVFSTTVALRYALGIGQIGSLTFDPLQAPAPDTADVTIHELSLHIGSALDF